MHYVLLLGEGSYTNAHRQATLPRVILELIHEVALLTWEKIDGATDFKGTFLKIFKALENYIQNSWVNHQCYTETI